MGMLDDVAAYLQEGGYGEIQVDLFGLVLPDEPDNCIALFEYGGGKPSMTMQDLPAVEEPRLQILVRNVSPLDGRKKIFGIFYDLCSIGNTMVGENYYLTFDPVQSPFYLTRDLRRRVVWDVNFSVHRQPDGVVPA